MAAFHFMCVQMQRDCQAQVKWSYWERKSMHRWRLIANRDILTSRAGRVYVVVFSLPIDNLPIGEKKHCQVGYGWLQFLYVSLGFQVCQAPSPTASASLHWLKVPGAPVLLQADWRHPNRHLLNGNAWSTTSAHLTGTSLDPVQSGLHQGIAVPPGLWGFTVSHFPLTPSPTILSYTFSLPHLQTSTALKKTKLSGKKKLVFHLMFYTVWAVQRDLIFQIPWRF